MENLIAAKSVYYAITSALNNKQLKYQSEPDQFRCHLSFSTDDLDVKVTIFVDAERELIRLISFLPFTFPEDKRIDGALAAIIANHGMIHGSFDFDFDDGQMIFKLTNSYKGGPIDDECVHYLLGVTVSTIDKYDDQFLAIAKGYMSLSDFIEKENQ
jgi:hypothetical protein